MKILKTVSGLAAAAAVSLFALSASAQTYPERNITMVVPFSAGGPTDTVARLVAESMSKDLGQQIIVENVGGAGGTLGAGRVASADPMVTPSFSTTSAWRPAPRSIESSLTTRQVLSNMLVWSRKCR